MRVIEFIHLIARTRSENRGSASKGGWCSACDYIAREVILQQPNPVRSHLENAYRSLCERADSDAKVFVRKKKKEEEEE